jgi:hypothetical protein
MVLPRMARKRQTPSPILEGVMPREMQRHDTRPDPQTAATAEPGPASLDEFASSPARFTLGRSPFG